MNGAIPSLLRIDSSIRDGASVSRAVANTFESAWVTAHPGGTVSRREIGLTPLPYLTDVADASLADAHVRAEVLGRGPAGAIAS